MSTPAAPSLGDDSLRDDSLRDDAIAIWQAGVDAVRAETLMQVAVQRDGDALVLAGDRWPLDKIGRLVVVGAGKAGAGMAAGFEKAIGDDWLDRVTGWVNVPADCVQRLKSIHLHAARPAGVNEPTEAGVVGTARILDMVGSLGPKDVCIVLISGGGSALLPAPVEGASLEDKQAITRDLSRAGASIGELNCVRKQLSQIKGGRLAAACTAGRMITLVISDVIGDPLDVIASGPTAPDTTTAADALAVLKKYADRIDVRPSVLRHLQSTSTGTETITCDVRHHVIGNVGVALDAAVVEAQRRGYNVQSLGGANEGIARQVGVELAEHCLSLRDTDSGPTCLLSGGEPTVHVVSTDKPRKGGRNQELILAAVGRLWGEDVSRIALLSAGTDGEDGPTDAAGAFVDAAVMARAKSLDLDPAAFLVVNDSYPFFDRVGGHLKTGPTHTNVMDLRVAVVR